MCLFNNSTHFSGERCNPEPVYLYRLFLALVITESPIAPQSPTRTHHNTIPTHKHVRTLTHGTAPARSL